MSPKKICRGPNPQDLGLCSLERVTADVISQDEVILEWAELLIYNDWCLNKERRQTYEGRTSRDDGGRD